MTTAGQWVAGARPRTLAAALAPVMAGTGAAAWAESVSWARATLALVVSVALQVGVNYANDYSDGVRGTDAVRVGPMRLVGSGAASAGAVKRAALVAFAVACAAGLLLAALASWWLVLVGAAAVAAAWNYTGGPRPYGYAGLGEAFVFVFFGLVAVVGTTYVQVERLTAVAVALGCAVGAVACALLVANNLRDIPTDALVGKRTLAVRLGTLRTRRLYVGLLAVPFAVAVGLAVMTTPWALLGLGALPLALRACRPVLGGAVGPGLIPTLQATGLTELAYAVLVAVGLWVG